MAIATLSKIRQNSSRLIMKHFFIFLNVLAFHISVIGQDSMSLTLEEAYSLAKQNYPLSRQQQLIRTSRNYSIENISKGNLPQLSINGQASYQSDVTEIPLKLPNIDIPVLNADQYRIYGEIKQDLYDGGVKKIQKKLVDASAAAGEQELEVELYKLKGRINEIYFGILLINEQLAQSKFLENDIQLALQKTKAAIANGIALKSSGDNLKAELLKVEQRRIELEAINKAYRDKLSQFINRSVDKHTILEKPVFAKSSNDIHRPELVFFDKKQRSLDVQKQLIEAKNRPKIGLFFDGGYGRPGLNMLKNSFEPYYIGGVRLNWSLSGLYTAKKEKALTGIKQQTIDLQKETFLFNTRLEVKSQEADINKLRELIKTDSSIIHLRNRIKNTALAQLEYGVINSGDYLRELNAEDQARQMQLLHEIQLLKAICQRKTTTGN